MFTKLRSMEPKQLLILLSIVMGICSLIYAGVITGNHAQEYADVGKTHPDEFKSGLYMVFFGAFFQALANILISSFTILMMLVLITSFRTHIKFGAFFSAVALAILIPVIFLAPEPEGIADVFSIFSDSLISMPIHLAVALAVGGLAEFAASKYHGYKRTQS